MARIVLGMGSSHSPQLSTPPEYWPGHGERDSHNPELLDTTGTPRSFAELLEMAPPTMCQELTPETWQKRHEANQKGIARLSTALADAALDILIIIGDDQREMFLDDNMPAIAVYGGETFLNGEQIPPSAPESMRAAAWGWGETDGDRAYPIASELERHLVAHLIDREFDVAYSCRIPPHRPYMGHAFGFVYRRIMQHHVVPVVPVLLNTYYPPNQPTPKRCYHLGLEIRSAIESFPSDTRVGVIASGGLSHFVIDEELDGIVMQALREGDADTLTSLPTTRLNSGSSEIRNWIAMAGAVEGLRLQWSNYVPCYRSLAGTGTAMGFGIWC
jgi:3-O-methylgallate 3,4-dioxygenase